MVQLSILAFEEPDLEALTMLKNGKLEEVEPFFNSLLINNSPTTIKLTKPIKPSVTQK